MLTNHLNLHFQSSSPTESRIYRRRRSKFNHSPKFSCQFNLFHNLISLFPSVNSLELIAPTLGFASGAALYLSKSNPKLKSDQVSDDFGEWILFTNPTPFNRFVYLRCQSIKYKEIEELNDLKFVKGRIQIKDFNFGGDFSGNLVYQRTCVGTGDGGVIALDWPANLDLNEEQGIDTTVLLVPGTVEGSMDRDVRLFVRDLLKRGCFPVVMNPRGCGGSPLTTARLFTAADSDDICTAIQFINKARPGNTLMSVGWGLGANMLTKYLAEVSEKTPLTAATCIDSPFDLEEATRSFPYHVALDQKLTSGLIDILHSNKELFQGRAKGFNVEKALSATSLRDFEREISMVSYGFESIEAFYSKSSTRELVGNVKIPLLFIQSDDGTVPPFSIPRGSISENPFTSLLLCSHLPSGHNIKERSVLPWCHHVAVEWLTAVELGFLKGRHPLLKDVDVTINPSAGLALVESTEHSGANKILNVMEMDASNRYHLNQIEYDTNNERVSVSQLNGTKAGRISVSQLKETGINLEDSSGSDDDRFISETAENPAENDKSQALQSAEAVMKMLDSTMPGTLKEEQKRKVMTAVANGETLMKALEGAVPEDVRGKLTGAVSEIVKNRATNLNLQGVMNVLPAVRSQKQLEDEIPGRTDSKETAVDKHPQELESDSTPSHTPENILDQGQAQSGSSETKESNQHQDQEEILRQKEAKSPGYDENDSESNKHDRSNKANGLTVEEKEKIIADVDKAQTSSKEDEGVQMKKEDVSDDQNKSSSTSKMDENNSQATASQPQPLEEEPNPSSSKVEDKSIQTVEDEIRQVPTKSEEPEPSFAPTSISSSFNVSQALDALTGFDDSTQVAVNSVFGVLENMIAKLEEDTGQENKGKPNEFKDEPGASEETSTGKTEEILRNGQNNEIASRVDSSQVQHGHPAHTDPDTIAGSHWNVPNGKDVKQLTRSNYTSVEEKNGRSNRSGSVNRLNGEKQKLNDMIDSTISEKPSAAVGSIYKIPQFVTVNPYGDSMYNEYLRRYLLSRIPNTKSLDLDSTADLLLDYLPEEGQWTLLDQTEDNGDTDSESESYDSTDEAVEVIDSSDESDTTEIIETSYVVLDSGKEQRPIEEYKTEASLKKKTDDEEHEHESELVCLVKNIILDSLNVEVGRRLGVSDSEEMDPNLVLELENVSKVVSLAVGQRKELRSSEKESTLGEVGPLHGEDIVQAVTLAVNDSVLLKRVLPVGVIVGSSLAALKKHFSVTTQHDDGYSKGILLDPSSVVEKKLEDHASDIKNDHKVVSRHSDNHTSVKAFEQPETENNNDVVVGAVTAALGASAFLASQQRDGPDESVEISSGLMSENGSHPKEQGDNLDDVDEKNQNPVSSLAEKAMSVAGPVVPTKSEGGIDQERLVAMLSDLGQKGGMLRMVGKLALLWGGIRGAMSLTDRLISFLHIADRPLIQRVLGFAVMVLVLWSPVVLPLFPTLVQGWATHTSTGIAEYACVIGLYTAVTILIILWGKRIRGYNSPLNQYGLDLTSKAKLLDFLKGLAGGVMLVLSIHSINTLLGCAHFSWSSSSLHTSFPNATETLKAFGKILLMAGQGIVTATVVVIVEELLFRSWLPEEITVEHGYHRAVIIAGFAFSILQRSVRSIPGLWLLSIALSGLKQRNEGSLSIPIGMRAGILSSSFILRTSKYITYHSGYPLWLAGAQPMQPFDGVVGVVFCIMLAVVLYPRQPRAAKEIQKSIQE